MMYDTLYEAMSGDTVEQTVPQWTARMLADIVDGRSDVVGVRHPLGFVCLPLERTDRRGVCVHIWSDRLAHVDSTTSATHAHSWDLLSYVLFGSLRNELVGVADEPQQPTHRVFEVASNGEDDEIRRTGRLVRSQTTSSEILRRGDVYSLPAGVFHETVARGDAATVALGHGRSGSADLTLGAVHTDSHRTRRQRVAPEETAYAATLVVEHLAALPKPRR